MVSTAKSTISRAPSAKSPVPQWAEPSTNPHSAVSKAASNCRTWKIPTAVSVPAGTTAKQA